MNKILTCALRFEKM